MVRLGPVTHIFHQFFHILPLFQCYDVFVDWDDSLSSFPSQSFRTSFRIWTVASPNGNDT